MCDFIYSSLSIPNFNWLAFFKSKGMHTLCDSTNQIVSKSSVWKGKEKAQKNSTTDSIFFQQIAFIEHKEKMCWTRSIKEKKSFWQLSTNLVFICDIPWTTCVVDKSFGGGWRSAGFIKRFKFLSGLSEI